MSADGAEMHRRLLNLLTRLPMGLVLRRRLVVIAICLTTCLLLGSCSADRLILGTDPGGTVDPAGAKRQLVRSEGKTIECWVARSPGAQGQADQPGRGPEALVLFFVGKGVRT